MYIQVPMALLQKVALILLMCFYISHSFEIFEDDMEVLCDDMLCEDYECPDTTDCLYGEVLDVCQCCFTCAKGPGEQCGGMFNLAGECIEGYVCQPHPKYTQMPGVCVEDSRK